MVRCRDFRWITSRHCYNYCNSNGIAKCVLKVRRVIVVPMKRSIATAAHDTPMSRATSSSSNADVDIAMEPKQVALVWKYASATAHRGCPIQNEPYIHVSLQPTIVNDASNTTTTTTPSCDSNETPARHDTVPSNDDVTINSEGEERTHKHSNTDTDSIPDSVLIYERQIRKAQHARKTSQPLSEDDLNVIYVDEHIVVINKPAGVLTVPGLNSNPSILDLVYQKYGAGSVTDPVHMIVHRLDMDTSGIVVFARTLSIAKQLHAVFRNRTHISKQYECLVMGHLVVPPNINSENNTSTENGVVPPTATTKLLIDLAIQRDHVHPPFMRISTPRSEKAAMECVDQLQLHGWKKIMRKAAKPSQTIVLQILEHGMYDDKNNNICNTTSSSNPIVDVAHHPTQQSSLPYTRLRLEPITGRTHQLRVHWYVMRSLFLCPCVRNYSQFMIHIIRIFL
jgi:23S rRNA-/tRNA-specific pseudouridylate synthase